MRAVAIDWSGVKGGGAKTIWTAISADAQLQELFNGLTRDQVADHLIELAQSDPDMVVGLDFPFSAPAWFVTESGATDGPEFWKIAASEGEKWLSEVPDPFWAKGGKPRPSDVELFRETETKAAEVAGSAPKSVFQIAGGGHPGTGAIRGMPILDRLASEGFRAWPFHAPEAGRPLVVEIYPRLLTGRVVKSDGTARKNHLLKYKSRIPDHLAAIAAIDEDQFDAAISAAVMDHYLDELKGLGDGDEVARGEGQIWWPPDPSFRPDIGLDAA